MSAFIVQYDDVKNLSIANFLNVIKNTPGKPLDKVKLIDLSFIYPGEGVYVFKKKSDGSLFHIGKVSSMSFIERIPKHFDTRTASWMNRLLKIICEKYWQIEINDNNLNKAAKFAFNNLELFLLNFNSRHKIDRIERLLRSTDEPLNKFKTIRIEDHSILVGKY